MSAEDTPSRRAFLRSSSGLLTSVWLAANWPAVRAAAHDAQSAAAQPADTAFKFLSPDDAADVEAVAAQIVPSGATPGARETHAVHFIDRALSGFFASMADDFRRSLQDFQAKCRTAHQRPFAALSPGEQLGFLQTVDRTAFFESMRTLTLLGMFSSPKYGGNFEGSGWKLMGFEDRHIFTPPFGHYDRDYPGFVAGEAKT